MEYDVAKNELDRAALFQTAAGSFQREGAAAEQAGNEQGRPRQRVAEAVM